MTSLAELSSADREQERPAVTAGWVEELGAMVMDESTMLLLRDRAQPELGWRMLKAADVAVLPAPINELQTVAA